MQRACILRQILIQCSLVISSISEGLVIGQVSGMAAALQSSDSDVIVSKEEISWIVSITIATSFIGLGLAAIVSTRYGRRRAITLLTAPVIVTWIMLYYGKSAAVFFIAKALVGIFSGGVLAILFVATGEYSSSKNRQLCLYIVISVSMTLGTALSHILCIIFHWRTMVLISIIPGIISTILPFFWVESPSWLASKGRFVECEAAFRALHGHSESTDAELNLLLDVEKSKQSNKRNDKDIIKTYLRTYFAIFTTKSFWNLFILSTVVIVYKTAAGKYLFITLAITMLQDLTGSNDILVFTLVVDGFFLLGTCLSCLLISKVNMRTLMFTASAISIILLVLLTTCIYYNITLFINTSWTNCILLALYLITINVGPYPVLDSLVAEIYPLELKEYYIFLLGVVASLAVFLNLKLAFDMINLIGYHGIFLLNIVLTLISIIYLWFRLPETKGRTLQEIEMFFEHNTYKKVDKIKQEENHESVILMNGEEKGKSDFLLHTLNIDV